MKRAMSRILVVAIVGTLATLVACGGDKGGPTEGDMEKAGQEAGKAADEAATKADKAAGEAGKALENVGN